MPRFDLYHAQAVNNHLTPVPVTDFLEFPIFLGGCIAYLNISNLHCLLHHYTCKRTDIKLDFIPLTLRRR